MSHYFLIFLGSGQKHSDTENNVLKSLKVALMHDAAPTGTMYDGPDLHFFLRKKAVPELLRKGGQAKEKLKAKLPQNRKTHIVCIGHSRGAVLAGAFAKWLKKENGNDQDLKDRVGDVSVLSFDPVAEIGGGFLGGPSPSKTWAMGGNLARYWYVYMSDPTATFQRLRLAQCGENDVNFRWLLVPGKHGSATKNPSGDSSAKILLSIAYKFIKVCGFDIGGGPDSKEVCKAYFDAAMKYGGLKVTNTSKYAALKLKSGRKAPGYRDQEAADRLSDRGGLFINSHLYSLIDANIYYVMRRLYDNIKGGDKIVRTNRDRVLVEGTYNENAFKYIKKCAKRAT